MAVVRVADRGPGVDPRHLNHVFDRYTSYRVAPISNGETIEAVDTHQGLGLWIVKRNVEGLRGSVTAGNREGGGFAIEVRLRIRG